MTSLILVLLAACNSGSDSASLTDDTAISCDDSFGTLTAIAWDDGAPGLTGTALLDQLDALGLATVRDVHWIDAVGGQAAAPASLQCDRQAATLQQVVYSGGYSSCARKLEVTIPCALDVADGGLTAAVSLRVIAAQENYAYLEASEAPVTMSAGFATSSGWTDAGITLQLQNSIAGYDLALPLQISFVASADGAAYGAFSFE